MTTPVRPPAHLLHIGPWASGVAWRAVPNKGLLPTASHPAMPLLALTDTTSVSVTLNRDDVSEATIEIHSNRGSAIVIQEMVTDLWWRRHNYATGVTENIGRFQARDVQLGREGDQIHLTAQWQDYRGTLEDRLIYDTTHHDTTDTPPGIPYPATTTAVTTILRDILPVNSLVNMAALGTVNLGTIGLPLSVHMGDTVGETITNLRKIAPLFDWSVELVGDAAVLSLWGGNGRGTNKGVILVDKGTGYTPMTTWDRRTNAADFASLVIVTGQTGSQAAALDWTTIPQGQRDHREDNQTLATQALILKNAQEILAIRSATTSSWQVELAPGYWQGRSHIDLGDTVRLVVQLGAEILDESLRVEQITIDVPPTGIETVTLTLGIARPDPDPRRKRSGIGKVIHKIVNRLK
jgi:hypothetical protein